MLDPTAEGHRVRGALGGVLDVGDAPVVAAVHHRPLVVEEVRAVPGLPGPPVATQAGPLEAAVGVGRELDAIVLVRLGDRALGVGADEVDGDPQVAGGEVGEAVGGHLVGDVVPLLEVLDRQVAVVLCGTEEADGSRLGDEDGRRVVVRLDPLAQVALEVGRLGVLEGEVPEGLEHHRPGGPHAEVVALRDVDDAAPRVGHRAGGPGHALHPFHGEAVVGGQALHVTFGGRALPAVARGGQVGSGQLLHLGEVVVALAHLGPQADVGQPRPVAGLETGQAGTADLHVGQDAVEADKGLQHVVVETGPGPHFGQLQGGPPWTPLVPVQLDLEFGPAAGRGRIQKVGGGAAQGISQLAKHPEAELDPTVLDLGQVRGGSSDSLAQ